MYIGAGWEVGELWIKVCSLSFLMMLVHSVAELVSQRDTIDADKVFLCGGSHGGFITAILLGKHPDFYAGGTFLILL